MSAGNRFVGWIEERAAAWGVRLASWGAQLGADAASEAAKRATAGSARNLQDIIDEVVNDPNAPEAVKNLGRQLIGEGSWWQGPLGEMIWFITSITSLISGNATFKREWEQYFEYHERTTRLDPISMITAWRRDPETYEQYFADLKLQGWSDDRIEALKFVTLFYPGPSDLVRFQAREVFEPEMISRYGLDDEFEGIDLEPFRKAGMTDEITRYYWRAHWEHASWNQVVEMLHRGQLTEDEVRDWFRLVEIPPFWRDKLIATSWNVPTRVDVRRFYDLRTIDESRLREIYTAMGYHGKDLDDYILWTKIYVEFPDLLARWKNGWISLDNVRQRLTELGMSESAAEELIQTKVQAEGAARTASERDLTKTDIYKGVKMERITRLEGLELLMDLGYDENEASFLLDINAPDDGGATAVQQRQLTKADVRQGLQTGLIDEVEARQKLLELRYTPLDVEFLIDLFNVVNNPPEEIKLKEASKADIVLGVTRGLITPQEAHAMLLDIGYAPEAADFILTVRATESPFSPVDITEFKDLTTKWRRSAGMVTLPVPDELREAARELVRIDNEVKSLELAVRKERQRLTPDGPEIEPANEKLTRLQVALNRARAEQERIKVNYDGLVAAWKHGQEGK